MTLVDRLADAHRRALQAYLQRQQLEHQRQQIAAAILQCEHTLLMTDGEVTLLEALIAEAP